MKTAFATASYLFSAGFFCLVILAMAYTGDPMGVVFAGTGIVSGVAAFGYAMLARS